MKTAVFIDGIKYSVGDIIRIIYMDDKEGSKYEGREGEITHIDDMNQLHGTWGGLAIIPDIDIIEKV